jgi:purine-binding chemotaxis protein CheW
VSAHLRFVVGRERYVVPVRVVAEVELSGAPTPVPGAGPHVVGVRSVRGELVPVLRLAGILGIDGGSGGRMVVVQDGDRRAGLAVDRIEDIETVDDAQLGPSSSALTAGTITHADRLVGVLDVAAALDAACIPA